MSTRDLLRKSKPKVHDVDISIGKIFIRALTGGGRAAYLDLVAKYEPKPVPTHEIAILGLCHENGQLEFDLKKEEDVADVAGMDGEDLQKIVLKLFEVSGLSKESAEAAEKKS